MILNEGTPVQLAWVTHNLDETEDALSKLFGAKKWVRMSGAKVEPNNSTFRGAPVGFVADASLSYVGGMQLEIVAPVSGDNNIFEDFLAKSGPGLHHVALETDDVEAAVQEALSKGSEVIQRGVLPGVMEYAFVASSVAGPPFVEISKYTDEIKSFFHTVRAQQL
jgi:catechol 2,3-dioxygenase-like lactoylglutathione lyase family enzyme